MPYSTNYNTPIGTQIKSNRTQILLIATHNSGITPEGILEVD